MGRKRTHALLAKSRAWSSWCCALFSVTNRAHIYTSCITEIGTLYKCICFLACKNVVMAAAGCRVSKFSRSFASRDYQVTSNDSPQKTRRVNSCNWILADLTTLTPLHKSLLFFHSLFYLWRCLKNCCVCGRDNKRSYVTLSLWLSSKCVLD